MATNGKTKLASLAPEEVIVRTVERRGLMVEIVGVKGLLQNRISDLSRRQLAKEPLTKEEKEQLTSGDYLFQQSTHRDQFGRYAVPAMAVYRSVIAINELDGKRVNAMTRYLTLGCDADDLLPLILSDDTFRGINAADREPERREDIAINWNARGVKVIATRALFRCPWSLQVPFIFDAERLSAKDVVAIVEAAGFRIGLGCWRPACKGLFGQYATGESREFMISKGAFLGGING